MEQGRSSGRRSSAHDQPGDAPGWARNDRCPGKIGGGEQLDDLLWREGVAAIGNRGQTQESRIQVHSRGTERQEQAPATRAKGCPRARQSTLQHLARQKRMRQPHQVKGLPVRQVLNALGAQFDALLQRRRCHVATRLGQRRVLRLESDHAQPREELAHLDGNRAHARPHIEEPARWTLQAFYEAIQSRKERVGQQGEEQSARSPLSREELRMSVLAT